jgi:hypothetical protein
VMFREPFLDLACRETTKNTHEATGHEQTYDHLLIRSLSSSPHDMEGVPQLTKLWDFAPGVVHHPIGVITFQGHPNMDINSMTHYLGKNFAVRPQW